MGSLVQPNPASPRNVIVAEFGRALLHDPSVHVRVLRRPRSGFPAFRRRWPRTRSRFRIETVSVNRERLRTEYVFAIA